jgi:hypothetical protein
MFRQSFLCKNEDPDAWIKTLEELRIKLEDMGLAMIDDQLMIYMLNNLAGDKELQIVLLEKKLDLNKKISLKEKVANLILELKDQEIKVKILRFNNAVENKLFVDVCKSKGFGIVFEYAGPRKPQRNGKVEWMF